MNKMQKSAFYSGFKNGFKFMAPLIFQKYNELIYCNQAYEAKYLM